VEQPENSTIYQKRIESLEKALDNATNLLACLNIDEKDSGKHLLVSKQVEKIRLLLKASWKKNLAG